MADFKPISVADLDIEANYVLDTEELLNDLQSSNYGVRYEIPVDSDGNMIVDGEMFESMTGRMLEFYLVDGERREVYSLSYNSGTEFNPLYVDDTPLNVRVSGSFNALEVDMSVVQNIVNDKYGNIKAFYVNMHGTGYSPYEMTIRYYMGTESSGEVYAVMAYHEGDLEFQSQIVTVDEYGYITFTTDRDTKHVLLNADVGVDDNDNGGLISDYWFWIWVVVAIVIIAIIVYAAYRHGKNNGGDQ